MHLQSNKSTASINQWTNLTLQNWHRAIFNKSSLGPYWWPCSVIWHFKLVQWISRHISKTNYRYFKTSIKIWFWKNTDRLLTRVYNDIGSRFCSIRIMFVCAKFIGIFKFVGNFSINTTNTHHLKHYEWHLSTKSVRVTKTWGSAVAIYSLILGDVMG